MSGICLSLAACATFKKPEAVIVPFTCIVQADTEVNYELNIDGKFVSCGKTLPPGKGMQICEMTATAGDHVLMVTAPGYRTWLRTVTLMSGTRRGSHFRVDLEKAP